MALDFSKNNYLYTIGVSFGALVISLLLIFLIIRPTYLANDKLTTEIKNKKENLNALETKLSKLKELKKEETKLLEQKEKVLAALPQDKDVSRLFVQFEKMITSVGGTVSSAAGQATTDQNAQATGGGTSGIPGINSHTYSLTANTSTYEAFKNLLTNTETALRLVDISDISISKKESGFDLVFGLKTYTRAEDKK